MLNLKRETTSKTIGGISDLVVWAPIREGFINAFENITYETRLKLTAEALHDVRVSAREHELIAPFPDTAERILSLLNFRIGVVDDKLFRVETSNGTTDPMFALTPRRYMYLVATFDGPWEPYMRLIWDPLGPFLDLLLCNCVPYCEDQSDGYRLAQESSFEEYATWVRKHQLDPAIFYSTTGLTVRDQIYLTKLEKFQRTLDPAAGDHAIAKMTHDLPEVLAADVRHAFLAETIRLGFEALTVLFRLADYYPPYLPGGTAPGDGQLLLRAAYDLLYGLTETFNKLETLDPATYSLLRIVYAEPLAWFDTASGKPVRPAGNRHIDRREIQKGILSPYDMPNATITHGAILFMQIRDAALAREFLKTIPIDWESGTPSGAPDHIFHNIAFTFDGLRCLQLSEPDLLLFPKEFREGSSNRAPLIGDVRENHPREWRLPPRNWPDALPPDRERNPPINLGEIDVVIQLRTSSPPQFLRNVDFIDFGPDARATYDAVILGELADREGAEPNELADADLLPDVDHPLGREIGLLAAKAERYGVVLLGFESMMRPDDPSAVGKAASASAPPVIDHFGFRDGLSQPTVDESLSTARNNDVPPGDLICGYRNSLTDADWLVRDGPGRQYIDNGSFMVLRKMSQNRAALDEFITRSHNENPDLSEEEIAASLVGRTRAGVPLAAADTINDFTYAGDPTGEECPFAAHIRRANPRESFQGRSSPRMLRRGMTYGHRYPGKDPKEPRGSLFMAYVANIAEQYEVVQRWINGGNATHVGSAQNDPLVGIAPDSQPRTFRFIAKDKIRRLTIKTPFVGLEYMLYLFVPSKAALRLMIDPLSQASGPFGNQQEGQDIINLIHNLKNDVAGLEWKRLVEDFEIKDPAERSEGPDVWAAIRNTGGALLVKDGIPNLTASVGNEIEYDKHVRVVLVGTNDLIEHVLSNYEFYSVIMQTNRTKASFGKIFVALDPEDSDYDRESCVTNEIVWNFSKDNEAGVFHQAYSATAQRLGAMRAASHLLGRRSFKLELRRELFMPVLGDLCRLWFDIPDVETDEKPQYIEPGGWGWGAVDAAGSGSPPAGARKVRCPGDFMAPSRFCFYPRPTPTIEKFGIEHGQALGAAAARIVKKYRNAAVPAQGLISKEMYAQIPDDDDLLARNLIGIMEGMLPPTDGILRGIVYEWLDQNTIWRWQGALHRETKGKLPEFVQARAALEKSVTEAMCKRPAPDLIYRTATKRAEDELATLGDVKIKEGDCIVLGLVSAMQASLGNGTPDITAVFGGNREKAHQDKGKPAHACPAQKMVMAMVYGILSALLDSGRIIAQPSSLIIEISEFPSAP